MSDNEDNFLLSSNALPVAVLKNLRPSFFYGKPNEDVDDWIDETVGYLSLFNVNGANSAKIAKTLLKGNARAWARTYTTTYSQPWTHFTDALRVRFGSSNSKFFARTKIYQLKQKGSVTSYIQAFTDLQFKIDDLTDPEAIHCFISGLKPRIQEHFAGNPDLRTDLNQVMRVVESLDSVTFQNRPMNPHRYVPRPSNNGPQPMELDALQGSSTRKQEDIRKRTCFYCHKPGHQARQCPNKSSSRKAQSH